MSIEDDWADDLLALAEEPVKSKKKKSKKRKREEETIDSASDMDVSAGSDAEVDDKRRGKHEDGDDDAENGADSANLYPLEGLYRDAADKASIMNMTEVERESILDERRTQMEQHHNRQLLKQMVAKGADAGGDSSDDDDNQRTRRSGRTGKVKQLDELKKRRQAKSARDDKKARGDDSGAEDVRPYDQSSPAGGRHSPSDDDEEYGKSSKSKSKDKSKTRNGKEEAPTAPATTDELNRIIIPRRKLAYFWPCEFFSEYVTGAYVRLGVGMHKGERIYRIAQIMGISEKPASKPYQLDKHLTDIRLQLSIAKATKDFSMELISDTPATDREQARLVAELQQADMPVPTSKTVLSKKKVIDKYKEYSWTEFDLSRVVAMKKRTSGASGMHRRQELLAARDMALRNGDAEEVARLNTQLGAIEDGNLSNSEAEPILPKAQAAMKNGSGQSTPLQSPLKNATLSQNALDDRRKNLLAASKAQAGQRPMNGSRPGSGTSTPARQLSAIGSPALSANGQTTAPAVPTPALSQAPTRFQNMLASKVDVDLGDF